MRAIDADALEKEGWSLCRTFQKDKDTMVYETKKLSDLPIIEERKTGHWEDMSWRSYIGHRCSVCGESCSTYVLGKPRDRFCKWCGAKMEGEEA
jgi:hypothetical protein